jgi:hypothetical protein
MDLRVVGLGIIIAIIGIPLMFLNMAQRVPYQTLEVYSEKQPYTTYKIEEKTETKTVAQPYLDKETTTRTEYKVSPVYDYTYHGYSWWWGYPYWYSYYYDPSCCGYGYYPYYDCCDGYYYPYYYPYNYYHVDYKTEPYEVTDTSLVLKYKEVQTEQKSYQTTPVTEYRDVTKVREVTGYRTQPVLWPQFLGGGLILAGLMTVLGGFFIGRR